MDIDTDKIDEAALALLYLTLHDGSRAWKGLDWDVMNRLHEKGFISNPVGKAKSVLLTEKGRHNGRLCKSTARDASFPIPPGHAPERSITPRPLGGGPPSQPNTH
jgi:uncharacterized protein DUF6429